MATGKTGGTSFWGNTIPKAVVPPGNALLAKEQAATARQAAGKNPSIDPIGALLHGTASPAQRQAMAAGVGVNAKPVGAPVFNPISLGIDQLLKAPSIVSHASDVGTRLAHPKPGVALPGPLDILLSGAVGVPRGGLEEPHPRMVPKVPKGETTPGTAGELGKQVREGLRGASGARKQQDKLYSAERSKRVGAAATAMEDIGGVAGHKAALAQLKGELPKLQFGGFENFDQAGLDALFNHIQAHPTLRPFEKIRTQTALSKVLNGSVPTKGELGLLNQVFGKEVSGRIAASVPTWAKVKHAGLEVLNIPRSVMSSFDLSAPFRQGLVAGAGHPGIFAKNFAPMVKSFGSEKVYQAVQDDIASRSNFERYQKGGLALTDLENMGTREEQLPSNYAEKIPVAGRVIRGSGRAYVAFLSKMRADVFDSLLKSADGLGHDINDEKLLKSIASYVNAATGRGDLGVLKNHAVTLNTVFFSPRLLASRINFLNPVYYAKLDPIARMQALKSMRNLVGAVSLVLGLAKAGGASVNTDPRNADFGKMRFGNTRVDILGGFQQPIRLMAQLFSGKVISSTTGKTLTLGPQGPGKLSRKDIIQRFAESKFAPVPSFLNDISRGTDSVGQPLEWSKFTLKNPVVQRMLPLLAQDVYQLDQEKGLVPALGGAVGGGLGVGIQTYGAPASKASTPGSSFWKAPSGGSSGGSPASSFWGK